MRTHAIRAGTVALAGAALLSTAGCASEQLEPRGQSEPATAPTVGAGSDQAEPASAETETAEETEEREPTPEPEPEPAPDEGSRENPFLIGDEVGNDDWAIVLEAPYEAWDDVRAENQFNDPPADGMEFWMLPVTVTYTGEETGDPFWDLDFGFVSEDGRTYDDDCGVVPEELMDVGELYSDAEASANVCLEVPEGAGGLWTVGARFTDPVFFTAEED